MTDAIELVIVQHADKENVPGDPGLTDLGRRRATTTARYLAGSSWDALYTSPLRRAYDTAAVIGEACGLDPSVDDRLRERMNWGSGPQSQRIEEFLADWQRATADRSWTPPSGDSSDVTGARLLEAITDCVATATGPRVLVVSHGGATVDLLRTLLGDDALLTLAPTVIFEGIPSCALTRLAFDRSWRVLEVADTCHLGTE